MIAKSERPADTTRANGVEPPGTVADSPVVVPPKKPWPIEPRDEWERGLLAIGLDCGVSLPDSAFLAEELYD